MGLKIQLNAQQRFWISDVVAMTGLHRSTINRYCDTGKLKFERDPDNNYRVFEASEVKRLIDKIKGVKTNAS